MDEQKLTNLKKMTKVGVEINTGMMHAYREIIDSYEQESDARCQAKTARGTQCKYDAKYCEVHNPQKG